MMSMDEKELHESFKILTEISAKIEQTVNHKSNATTSKN